MTPPQQQTQQKAQPQPGIFVEGTRLHRFIELDLSPAQVQGQDAMAQLRRTLAELAGQVLVNRQRSIQQVLAFSRDCWSQLSNIALPSMTDFPGYQTDDGAFSAPATQRQCFIWLHGDDLDSLTDAYVDLIAILKSLDHQLFACDGFVYRDSRDLTGFVDGSANPKAGSDPAKHDTPDDPRYRAAVIPAGEPGEGGSFVMTQQWVHALEAFGELSVADQERVIGRTKADSIELTGDAMPIDSHVSRTDLKIDGVAQKIYRRSTPAINGDQRGLYFFAFSTELSRFEVLLNSMYGQHQRGVHDRLLNFSEPVSGSYWFAPSVADLEHVLQ